MSTKGPQNCRSLGFAGPSNTRDDKGKGNGSIESSCRTETFFITLGGPQAHDSSGRDDKGEGGASGREMMLHRSLFERFQARDVARKPFSSSWVGFRPLDTRLKNIFFWCRFLSSLF